MTDPQIPDPSSDAPTEDVGYGSAADTRAPAADDRRTPDDDRYGYGSEGYDVEEGGPTTAAGDATGGEAGDAFPDGDPS